MCIRDRFTEDRLTDGVLREQVRLPGLRADGRKVEDFSDPCVARSIPVCGHGRVYLGKARMRIKYGWRQDEHRLGASTGGRESFLVRRLSNSGFAPLPLPGFSLLRVANHAANGYT